MKKLLIFCFCSLSLVVAQGQNRITTDTVSMLRKGPGNIELSDSIKVSDERKTPLIIRDTSEYEITLIDSLQPVTAEKLQVLSATLVAGRTEATLDVSASGGATYTIPFALPPGINGVVPQLGLAYNSQGGNGMAGYGWNIYGQSSITRIAGVKYIDGWVGGVNLDMEDRFALDGQRLLLKSGTYGGDGAEYQTEQYSHVKVISWGGSPYGSQYGPEYFEVYHSDGSKAFYGQTPGSRSRDQYALTYIENPQGVRISYTYDTYSNQLYIAGVRYGSRGADPAINEIIFSYGGRTRAEQRYIGGEGFYINRRISKISVKAGTTFFRNYIPTYSTLSGLNYERMTQIQEFDGSENYAFEPIYFMYDDTGNLVTTQTISNLSWSGIASNNSGVMSGDFTGNGSMDFLLYPTAKNKFYAFYDLDPGNPYMQLGYEVNTGAFQDIFPTTWLTYNDKILSGQGMLVVKKSGTDQYKFEVYSSGTVTAVYYQYDKYWNDVPSLPGYYSICDGINYPGKMLDFVFVSGDFNGDGLTELIAVNRQAKRVIKERINPKTTLCEKTYAEINAKAYLIDMDRRKIGNPVTGLGLVSSDFESTDKLYAADFDGDGKTDFLVVKPGSMRVFSLNDVGTGLTLRWTISDSRVQPAQNILLGDYNGDGKMDVMFSTGYNNLFATFMSTGKGFVKHEQYQAFNNVQNTWDGVNTMQQHVLIPSDVNGDGKTDMIYTRTTTYNSTATGSIYVTVYSNTGINGSDAPLFGALVSTTKTTNVRHNPIPIFLNPDRQNPDLEFGFISDNTISLFKSHKNMQREALLTTIQQDGVIHEVEYARLMPDEYVYDIPLYESSYDQTFPYIDIAYAPSTRVVPRISRTAAGHTVQQVFGYGKAVSNVDGLGFVGFGELIRSNWHVDMLDSNRTFSIGIQDPQLRGANLRTFTSKWSYISPSIRDMGLTVPPPIGGVPDGATLQWDYISRQDVAYHTDTLTNKVFVNVPIATSTKDLLSGTYHNRQMKYDSLYNMIYLAEDINNEASKRSGMTYANSTGTPYYVGRLLSKRDTIEHASDIYTTEEQYAYTGYLPAEIKRKGHETDFVIDSLTYDVFGNVVERKMTVPGGAQRTEMMQYDVSGRFMTQHMDPDSLITTYSYDPYIGKVNWKADPWDRSEWYYYDPFARMDAWEDYVLNICGIYRTKVGTNTQIQYIKNPFLGETLTLFNPLDQKIEEQRQTVTGSMVGQAWRYDAYGRQTEESEWSEPGNYTQWNTVSYDKYGRVNREASYTGRVKSYTYTGLVTTVNDGAKSVTTTRNALGQVISVQDPGGTVIYSYYANGELKETDYGGSTQSIEQDGWGRKTKLTDPSAGVYTYSYDGWGQIVQETTPKGSTIYSYDGAGKLLSKNLVGDSTDMQWTYSYDPVHKIPIQTVLLNTDGNNSTYTYGYDYLFRPTSSIEDNIHAIFEKRYTYNWQNLLDSVIVRAEEKASGYQATQGWKQHYQNGQLHKTTLAGTGQVLWQIDTLDEKGLLTSVSNGSNLQTNFSYDSYDYPSQQKLERLSPAATLMTLGTTFNAVRGFPTARSNSVFSWNETFGYDNLDRLTTFNDNNGNHSQQYDVRGRITENSLLGQYSYLGNSYRQHELELNPTADLYYQSRSPQQISFNAFKKPVEIHETGHDRVSFQYNGALQRSHSYYGSEAIDPLDRPYRRHYSQDGSVEITRDMLTDTTSFVFYLGGDAYSAPAIWKVEQNSTSLDAQLYYLHRDYLGSILMITDSVGTVMEQRQFDAWGNIVKLTDGSSNPLSKFVILDRGYTGHEHLFGVALINMNGRLYDARLHRFLSPDNYVQDPWGTQNFNRYGYAFNNPLVYVDQNGEFILGTVFGFVGGLVKAVFSGGLEFWNAESQYFKNVWNDFGTSVSNGFKIDMGLWQGNFGQIVSRFTWELPQTLVGYGSSSIVNGLQNVKSVTYYGGATAVETYSGDWGGITLGSYVIGERGLQADPTNALFQHEYGHYLQSQASGLFYFPKYGIPSLFSKEGPPHYLHPAEQDANARAFRYFNENIEGYDGWVFTGKDQNPIAGYDPSLGYHDPGNQLALRNARLRLSWYDYFMFPIWPLGGVVNTFILNSRY